MCTRAGRVCACVCCSVCWVTPVPWNSTSLVNYGVSHSQGPAIMPVGAVDTCPSGDAPFGPQHPSAMSQSFRGLIPVDSFDPAMQGRQWSEPTTGSSDRTQCRSEGCGLFLADDSRIKKLTLRLNETMISTAFFSFPSTTSTFWLFYWHK